MSDPPDTRPYCKSMAKLVRLKVDEEFEAAEVEQVLFHDWCTSTYTHHVGTINWLEDGSMVYGAGDGSHFQGLGKSFFPSHAVIIVLAPLLLYMLYKHMVFSCYPTLLADSLSFSFLSFYTDHGQIQDECTDPKGPKAQGVFTSQNDAYLRGKFLKINQDSLKKNDYLKESKCLWYLCL